MLESMGANKVANVYLGGFGPVSQICFGTLTMSPLQRDMTHSEGARLILYAYERGIDFVDTAELYGTYAHIGLALRDAPELKVSTKCYAYDEATAERSFRAAVEGIGREYIDIFMLHEQESVHTLRGHEKALEYFIKQKERGYIGAVGISTHHVAAARAAKSFGGIDLIHPILNVKGLGIVDGTREDMENACRDARAAGIGIFAMKPLGGGHLIQNRAEAIAYIKTQPYIDAVAIGMQSEAEIDCNIALFGACGPEYADLDMCGITRELLIHDWCEGCGKCVLKCGHGALSLDGGRARVDASKCVLCGYCAAVCALFCIKVI